MTQDIIETIKRYVRAANYITATQIYLQDNYLLENKLEAGHIKPRLLGHWGTCPGINFVYANLNYLVSQTNQSVLFVLGPGHGYPALQANLYLEGALEKFYPEAKHNAAGFQFLSKNFSWPYGFPSHSNPMAPGVILEGGELGYSLSTAYGSVLDNPDLLTVCLIGDGEAETGPLSTAWNLNKFIDPEKNGAVLPILHLNGYKISGPTIFGRMSSVEIRSFFLGHGYEPFIVEEIPGEDIYKKMIEVLGKCYLKIREIQEKARSGYKVVAPMWPVIVLKTPKGWTGIKELNGQKVEGNFISHQVVAQNAKIDQNELEELEQWMRSYNFSELFDPSKGFANDIYKLIPRNELKIGLNKHAMPKDFYSDLNVPNADVFAEEVERPGVIGSSSMRRMGEFLNEVIKLNNDKRNFRFFSPDETYSNKLDKMFESTTRSFVWPIVSWDKDLGSDGRVIEMLSEHALFGLLQGYILTGRHGIFASYEAFVQIISSMADQYLKFIKVSRDIVWRRGYSSLNIVLTSSGWRQDHNGFSHQNPGFISDMLEREEEFVKVYFPVDGNTTLAVMNKVINSKDGINLIVAGKTLEPRWLNIKAAERMVEEEIMIWDFASDDDPDFVLCGIGDYVSKECLAAISLIKQEDEKIKLRFVNILEPWILKKIKIEDYFTEDKDVLFSFHGYPGAIKKFLFDFGNTSRFEVRGYIENGSTTTPYDMHVRNKTSRWHIVCHIALKLSEKGVITAAKAKKIIEKYEKKFAEHQNYIITHGVDLPEIENWRWS